MDDWSDDLDENENPEPDWDDDSDDETETMPCSHCGAEIYEDAEQCPVCGEYVSFSTSVWHGKSLPWVLIGLAGIIAVILTLAL